MEKFLSLLGDGDVNGDGEAGEHFIEVGGFHNDENAAVTCVDVDFRKRVNRFLDVDGHTFASAERRSAADVIAAVAVGRFGGARHDSFDAAHTSQVLRRNFAVAMHQANEGLFGFVFEDDCFDRGVMIKPKFGRSLNRTAMKSEIIAPGFVRDVRGIE